MIEDPCKKCDDPAMGCSNTCGDLAEYRYIKELEEELKKAKRLLKAAVEGYSFIGHITKDYACPSATSCSACPMDEGKQCRVWEHEAEALALIEDGST